MFKIDLLHTIYSEFHRKGQAFISRSSPFPNQEKYSKSLRKWTLIPMNKRDIKTGLVTAKCNMIGAFCSTIIALHKTTTQDRPG